MKKSILILCLLVLLPGLLFSHSGKPKYHVIIDTDGALDDMRAISMLLAGNDIRVLAITCSQGTLKPTSAYAKVKALLGTLYHDGIPVGIGADTKSSLPEWSLFAEKLSWGSGDWDHGDRIGASELLEETVKDYPYPLTLVAMGSLRTYADWIRKNPDNSAKIKQIIWYNEFPENEGFNYSLDPESYEFIVSSGIALKIVNNNREEINIDGAYLSGLSNLNSAYANQILKTHQGIPAPDSDNEIHLLMADDLLPLYLTVPVVFNLNKEGNTSYINLNKTISRDFIYDLIYGLLESGTETNNRVFNDFPSDKSLYKPEYAAIMDSVIEGHGKLEWKVITLTNEIHGHTGVYSIIGAKMGIRALEYFNVGVNNLEVISFAGNAPPLSCLNDGIQISTGATIGQGLIKLSDTTLPIPTVIFEFNKQKIEISLDPEIAEQIEQLIGEAVKKYDFSEQYWLYIEKLATRYWQELDRHEIFSIKKLS